MMTEPDPRPPLLLRELLAGPVEGPPPTADAEHFAWFRFGKAVADRIIWLVDEGHQVHGVLADDEQTLHLCYEYSEPGSECISALVVCPIDGRCKDAWGVVESTSDLLSVLNGEPHEDPQCLTHEAEIAGLDVEDDEDADEGGSDSLADGEAEWPPVPAW